MFSHYEECPRCVTKGQDSRRDNLGVYKDGGAHCWACGYHRPGSIVKRWASTSASPGSDLGDPNVPKSLLPFDFTREVPATAWQWLMQYGMPYTYWQESVGYSPSTQRLVFQVGGTTKDGNGNLQRTGPMAFSIGRYVGEPTTDKKLRKWHVWGDSHKHCEVVLPHRDRAGEGTVLVEDLVSAHKVAYAGYKSISLFGTIIHPCHLYYLLNDEQRVVFWLDQDQELNVKRRAFQLQSVLGREVDIITTQNDPKQLSITTITKVLQ